MAESPAHRFGQILGDVLEAAIEPLLAQFAREHDLYLDRKGERPARSGKQVRWADSYGNSHDLDYVFERNGTDTEVGTPVAFIEAAWRRYTKHSRNKAQELQGAILPLVETYKEAAPFIGAILAGVFTTAALTQLRSLGFHIVYFPNEEIIQAFASTGIDAKFDEDTPDSEVLRKVRAWDKLPRKRRVRVGQLLLELRRQEIRQFMDALERMVSRKVSRIRILPLHGTPVEWISVEDAVFFIEQYRETGAQTLLVKYEVLVTYTNGDRIEGQFSAKGNAIQFVLRAQH